MCEQPLLHECLREAHGKLKPYSEKETMINYPGYDWGEDEDDEEPDYQPGEVEIDDD